MIRGAGSVLRMSSAVQTRLDRAATSSPQNTADIQEKTRTTFAKVEEVIYQASAKNSRHGELLIRDTVPLDINIKDIILELSDVFSHIPPYYVLSLKLLLRKVSS